MDPSTILYFGSFNPVRNEHLRIAERTLEATRDTELWFVVSPHNPFKSVRELAPERDRLEMVRLALEISPLRGSLKASDVEFALGQPSLTFRTLERLENLYPGRRFRLLIGSDNVDGFDRWFRYDDILSRYEVLVYPREGRMPEKRELASRFTFLQNVPPGIGAATDIRAAIAAGEDPGDRLPERVWQYIRENRLYGYDTSGTTD